MRHHEARTSSKIFSLNGRLIFPTIVSLAWLPERSRASLSKIFLKGAVGSRDPSLSALLSRSSATLQAPTGRRDNPPPATGRKKQASLLGVLTGSQDSEIGVP